MRQDEGMLLATAVRAMRSTAAENTEVTASARRLADQLGIDHLGIEGLGIDGAEAFTVDQLESCGDANACPVQCNEDHISAQR